MTFFINPLLMTDSYKLSHRIMYPENTTNVYSNYTNRGSRIEGIGHVVHFGLQAYLKGLQEDFERFFAASKDEVVEDYRRHTSTFVSPGFSVEMIEDLHDLGYLPVEFSAVPEGTLVPIKVPSLTLESTHPKFAWIVNYLESNLSASIWHPSSVATIAWDLRRQFNEAAERTSDSPEATDFQLHDFSYRGHTSWQTAASAGAAHLLSSMGTDMVPTIPWIDHYYPGDNGLVGASVPATEHSVMCAGGKDDEKETFERLLKLFPEGILSVVSDTWDFWKVLTEILPSLKDDIMARDGKLVIRPDSGDPVDIITGTNTDHVTRKGETYDVYITPPRSIEDNPAYFGAIEILWELFGGTVNSKGYKELDPHIGLIYGDGMTKERIRDINNRLEAKGFASTNWVAGVGSYTYQMMTRDTFGSAVKATEVEVDGVRRAIFKDPVTDNGLKKSAKGRLAVMHNADGTLYLIDEANEYQESASLIQPVWRDGKFLKTQSFADVRATLKRNTEILERAYAI